MIGFALKHVKLTPPDLKNWIFSEEYPTYPFPTQSNQKDQNYTDSHEKVPSSEQVQLSATGALPNLVLAMVAPLQKLSMADTFSWSSRNFISSTPAADPDKQPHNTWLSRCHS